MYIDIYIYMYRERERSSSWTTAATTAPLRPPPAAGPDL